MPEDEHWSETAANDNNSGATDQQAGSSVQKCPVKEEYILAADVATLEPPPMRAEVETNEPPPMRAEVETNEPPPMRAEVETNEPPPMQAEVETKEPPPMQADVKALEPPGMAAKVEVHEPTAVFPPLAPIKDAKPPVEWIEIIVTDDEDRPLAYEPFRLTLPNGSVVEDVLNPEGRLYVDNLNLGACKFSLPNRDDWEPAEIATGTPEKKDAETATETAWIEIQVVDDQDQPLADEACKVTLADGTVRGEKLGADGKLRLEDIPSGACKISFPQRKAEDLELL